MYLTEQEIIESQEQSLYLLENQIVSKNIQIKDIAEFIPGFVHINNLEDISIEFVNNSLENFFDRSSDEIVALKENFFLEICHSSVFESLFPNLSKFYENGDEKKVMGFFQRLRRNKEAEFQDLIGFTKISKKLNCFISIENPIGIFDKMAVKMNKLVDDNEFLRKNFRKFASLTKREIEILKLIGNGTARNDIADLLFISKHTLDNHRKNIREKLQIKNSAELYRYIYAFDLI